MKSPIATIVLSAALLTACVSHDGTYSPGCIAYAGSKITLSKGEFVWEKFTDEVVVNDAGETVDRFPGYPLRGTYRIHGQRVLMKSLDGEAMEDMYLHRQDDAAYLYTSQQFEHLKSSGEPADCALKLEPGGA